MLLFSATMSSWIYTIITKHMINPIFLDASSTSDGETHLPNTITHLCLPYPSIGKSRLQSTISAIYDMTLLYGGRDGGQTVVFTNTKIEADQIVASDLLNGKSDQRYLVNGSAGSSSSSSSSSSSYSSSSSSSSSGGYNNNNSVDHGVDRNLHTDTTTKITDTTTTKQPINSSINPSINSITRLSLQPRTLHGGMSQHARTRTIQDFKEGKFQLLIATDIASRGLDVRDVDLIIQTQLPEDHDAFVHRVGRTGRAGRNGTSILLFNGGGHGVNRQKSGSSSSSSSSSTNDSEDHQMQLLTKDQLRIIEFERALNIKLRFVDSYTKDDIMYAIDNYQTRRINRQQQKLLQHQRPQQQQQQPTNAIESTAKSKSTITNGSNE